MTRQDDEGRHNRMGQECLCGRRVGYVLCVCVCVCVCEREREGGKRGWLATTTTVSYRYTSLVRVCRYGKVVAAVCNCAVFSVFLCCTLLCFALLCFAFLSFALLSVVCNARMRCSVLADTLGFPLSGVRCPMSSRVSRWVCLEATTWNLATPKPHLQVGR
ncbi:hypothetical protein LY78DRAFT_294770 [Colletotrichum sublineola]|nr:hypothetical protein LY78DRAFT_294770 [Colletotrichum sublineola]